MTLTLEPLAATMNRLLSDRSWESDLANLLEDLTQVQDELLAVLASKRHCMSVGDMPGMKALQSTEQSLCDRLQACHDRRGQLLQKAAEEGMPSGGLRDLASLVKTHEDRDLGRKVKNISSQMSLLQHNCLVNWVLAQKALLHASQMLEIIATGGRLQPTYGNRAGHAARGALVDQEV
jgi:flagellar biosynthesis/type III secretory pathway chaperone